MRSPGFLRSKTPCKRSTGAKKCTSVFPPRRLPHGVGRLGIPHIVSDAFRAGKSRGGHNRGRRWPEGPSLPAPAQLTILESAVLGTILPRRDEPKGTETGNVLIVGPVFTRELVTAPRRGRLFLYRAVYAGVLFGVMCTAWLLLTQTQTIRSVGDMARFGAILFQLLAPLQLAIVVFFAALSTAGAVSQEKDRKTLILLLLTRLNNSELVLGKLLASLVHVLTMLLAGLPVFALAMLFGGISVHQVVRVTLVTLVTALAAGTLGSTMALWREKTFQTLALTALAIVFWILICEAVAVGVLGANPAGIAAETWANSLSPLRAVTAAARPDVDLGTDSWWQNSVLVYCLFAGLATTLGNALAVARIRVWNPSREVRSELRVEVDERQSIWGAEHDLDVGERQARAERAREKHVDTRKAAVGPSRHRQVWTNPILWREVCTWAYGRKVIGIRVAYLLLAAGTLAGVAWLVGNDTGYQDIQDMRAHCRSLLNRRSCCSSSAWSSSTLWL